MISVADARTCTNEAMRLMPAEQIALADAFGRVLAEDLSARRTQPPHAVSAMDGYAVRLESVVPDAPMRVVGEARPGHPYEHPLATGTAVRIFTGAPLPEGADPTELDLSEVVGECVSVAGKRHHLRNGEVALVDRLPFRRYQLHDSFVGDVDDQRSLRRQ